jgi:hypothetical protein
MLFIVRSMTSVAYLLTTLLLRATIAQNTKCNVEDLFVGLLDQVHTQPNAVCSIEKIDLCVTFDIRPDHDQIFVDLALVGGFLTTV